eukprot:134106-Prorocentrum_minimum.AAC.1
MSVFYSESRVLHTTARVLRTTPEGGVGVEDGGGGGEELEEVRRELHVVLQNDDPREVTHVEELLQGPLVVEGDAVVHDLLIPCLRSSSVFTNPIVKKRKMVDVVASVASDSTRLYDTHH